MAVKNNKKPEIKKAAPAPKKVVAAKVVEKPKPVALKAAAPKVVEKPKPVTLKVAAPKVVEKPKPVTLKATAPKTAAKKTISKAKFDDLMRELSYEIFVERERTGRPGDSVSDWNQAQTELLKKYDVK